jgi:hypothetical protein
MELKDIFKQRYTNVYGYIRRSVIQSDRERKTLPAVDNESDCNKDKEMYLVPKRELNDLIFFEKITDTQIKKIQQNINEATTTVRGYIWKNKGEVNKEAGEVFSMLPHNFTDDLATYVISNIRFRLNSDNFKPFGFEKYYDAKPYICLTVDFELKKYYSCLELSE